MGWEQEFWKMLSPRTAKLLKADLARHRSQMPHVATSREELKQQLEQSVALEIIEGSLK